MTDHKPGTSITWNADADISGTAFVGYLHTPWTFEETVARLITLSQQDPTANTDGYKVSVEFQGVYNGHLFTLYDYKGDRTIHIGGHNAQAMDLDTFTLRLVAMLANVAPTPYTAREFYNDAAGQFHSYGDVTAAVQAAANPAQDSPQISPQISPEISPSYTSGPWIVQHEFDTDPTYIMTSDLAVDIATLDVPDRSDGRRLSVAERLANARLIAAAPELLRLVRRAHGNGAFSHVAGWTAEVGALLAHIDQPKTYGEDQPKTYGEREIEDFGSIVATLSGNGGKPMSMAQNPNCSGARCRTATGEVRLYPLGGGANLILCHACWDYENQYRRARGRETGNPANWPILNWDTADVYEVGL